MVDPVERAQYPQVDNPQLQNSKDSSAFSAGVKTQRQPVGSSGTDISGGFFSEEYLSKLRGSRGAKIWDEMSRSESQIAMLLGAVTNPIKSATWEVQAAGDSPEQIKHKELVEFCFKEMIDWEGFLHECLTFIRSGFSLFEIVHNVVLNHKKFGTFNGIAQLGFRSQKTIEQWYLEKKTGKITGVRQEVFTDVGESVDLPGEFLIVFTNQKEGDNYEGISALRAMYGPWTRKNLYLKLAAIGMEKYAIGTPVGTIPSGKEKTEEENAFKQVLSAYTSHETAYITKPQGWEIEIQRGEFDAEKIKELILLENTEMINALLANFLALGMNGNGGAYALGSDLSDFFYCVIQSYANIPAGVLNRKVIPDLIKLNFGEQESYPKILCTGINDKAGKELAEIIKGLKDAGFMTPDSKTEAFLRKQYKLPILDENAVRAPAPASTPLKFAEEDSKAYKKRFNQEKAALKAVMQNGLNEVLAKYLEALKKKYNAAAPADRVSVAAQVDVPGLSDYIALIQEQLAGVAQGALKSAEREVPTAKGFQLTEMKLALETTFYDALPLKIRKLVKAQAQLIGESQIADLSKVVSFQFNSSATGSTDIDAILLDAENAGSDLIDGSTASGSSIDAAAGNAIGHVNNQTRQEFFFAPEVLEEIESFTFVNEDPVSQICQELNGQTFAVNDPQLDQFTPPLHHNCKSRMVANLKGVKDNPEIDRGVSVSKGALKSMTLCEHNYFLLPHRK